MPNFRSLVMENEKCILYNCWDSVLNNMSRFICLWCHLSHLPFHVSGDPMCNILCCSFFQEKQRGSLRVCTVEAPWILRTQAKFFNIGTAVGLRIPLTLGAPLLLMPHMMTSTALSFLLFNQFSLEMYVKPNLFFGKSGLNVHFDGKIICLSFFSWNSNADRCWND